MTDHAFRLDLCRNVYEDSFTRGILNGVTDIATMQPLFTLERPWRQNVRNLSCIPDGDYKVQRYVRPDHRGLSLIVWGGCVTKFKNDDDPNNRWGILFHIGNHVKDSQGCILPGESIAATRDRVLRSTVAMEKLLGFCGEGVGLLTIRSRRAVL